jgi:hypothetical protein
VLSVLVGSVAGNLASDVPAHCPIPTGFVVQFSGCKHRCLVLFSVATEMRVFVDIPPNPSPDGQTG